jgi:FixJ family two-component response regulator
MVIAKHSTDAAPPLVFVVDDDDSFRSALQRLLTSAAFAVQAFPTARAFLDVHRPDVPACLVLDVQLPGLSGLDLQRELALSGATLPIIFLTGRGDIPMSVRAMKAGAAEFLTKPFREQDLLEGIRRAIDRDRMERSQRQELSEFRRRYTLLTSREREVMARVVAGLLNKQIAAEFGTTEVTVKEQRARVMQKMEAGSLAELVRIATRLEATTVAGGPDPGEGLTPGS